MLLAQEITPISNPALSFKNTTPESFVSWGISTFVRLMLTFGFLALIIYFIFGGFMWITSGGDAKKAEGASKQITGAVIGMGIMAAGWAIIGILDNLFGLNILQGFNLPSF